jgi:hypothetical protein
MISPLLLQDDDIFTPPHSQVIFRVVNNQSIQNCMFNNNNNSSPFFCGLSRVAVASWLIVHSATEFSSQLLSLYLFASVFSCCDCLIQFVIILAIRG